MTATTETINKMNALSDDNFTIIVNLIDYMTASQEKFEDGLEIFEAVRSEGIKNPMTEDEVDAFVTSVRKERRAAGH